jgi:hypothetical protein
MIESYASQNDESKGRQSPRIHPPRRQSKSHNSGQSGAPKAPTQRSRARMEAYRGTRTGRITQARNGQILSRAHNDEVSSRGARHPFDFGEFDSAEIDF